MMQSAAVLPTESPVKSLPEILGVPLQRKTFVFTLWLVSATCAAGFSAVGERRGGGGGVQPQYNSAGG